MGRICALLGTTLLLSTPPAAFPQPVDTNLDPDEETIDEIIVTGSRIKRSTYTSIPPLQILLADESRDVGLVDAAAILQESVAASGVQPDLTAIGFITDNGPGASTISLRGLDQARTLVLINGRRLAPAGVGGAPTAADLNLIPSAFVQRYEILLDGASSIYGSDAIAGVANIILRNDFDGFELEVWSGLPEQSGGDELTLTAAWGTEWDNGHLGLGVEHEDNEYIRHGQRSWSAECTQHVEIDETGRVRHDNLADVVNWGMAPAPCRTNLQARWAQLSDLREYLGGFDPGPSSMYFTPGQSNTGIPGFSDYRNFFLDGGIDADGDGVTDVQRVDYTLSDAATHLLPDFDRTSVMAYGEYRFSNNLAPFFELQYGVRKVHSEIASAQFFPWVPPDNPYNICNPDGIDGVDCAVAWNDHYTQQAVIDMFIDQYGGPPQAFGLGLNPPIGGMWIRPVVIVAGDRTSNDSEVEQTRLVAGLRGDLPGLESGSISDVEFELAFVGTRSVGKSHRPGIREDWLNESLHTSMIDPATGGVVCGLDTTGDGVPDGVNADGRACVPIDMFAPSLFSSLIGDFATAAERDYVFDSEDFYTKYEQWLFSAYLTADLFELPGGTAAGVLGFEFRNDEINSIPNEVARDRLLFGWFSGGGAVGEKFTREYFAEIELPLLSDEVAADELVVNLSGRYTTDELFGSETTYAARVGWRPVDSLLVRATTGTSFRAPNLHENFIEPSYDNPWVHDPCAIPEDAIDPINGYDPALDSREPHVLQNCLDQGVDPTTLDLAGDNWYRVPTRQGGSAGVLAETSRSYSYGLVWTPRLADTVDLSMGWTYYSIEVNNSIIKPNGQTVVNDCYARITRNNVLCARITRDPATDLMTYLVTDFLNRDRFLVSGHDVNVHVAASPVIAGQPFDLAADLVLNHPSEASTLFTDDFGNAEHYDFAGYWAFPDWKGTLSLRAGLRDWQFTWRISYIDAVSNDADELDEWGDVTTGSHTCLGPSQGDVLCRDVGFADGYVTHSTSLYYTGDMWTIGGGIRSVFNEKPPIVDPTDVFGSTHNVPLAVGYDLNGRVYFFNIQARFGS